MPRLLLGTCWFCSALLAGCDATDSEQKTQSGESISSNEAEKDGNGSPDPLGPLPAAPEPDKPLYAKSFINRPAPEFAVETWLTKKPEREGKMVLIDFWATDCPPCIKSIPKLNHFHRNYKDRLAVIGLSGESADVVRRHPGAKINYALAIDPEERMVNALQIRGIPYAVLIDPTGVVRWQGIPNLKGHELTEDVLVEMLDTYVR